MFLYIYGIYTQKNLQVEVNLNDFYFLETGMDHPEVRKKLQYLREQRSRAKKRLYELEQTTSDTNIEEELRLANYWKGQYESHKAAFEEYKQKEAFFKGRYDNALVKLEQAKEGTTKPIKVQKIRITAFDNEIDECEAILEGRKSKGLLQAEALVEEIQIKQMIEEHRYTPPTTPSVSTTIKKQPKQVKKVLKLNEISAPG